jgi:hypothetical protein
VRRLVKSREIWLIFANVALLLFIVLSYAEKSVTV